MSARPRPRSAAIALAMWFVSLIFIVAGIILTAVPAPANHSLTGAGNIGLSAFLVLLVLTIESFGVLVLARQPGNAVGWIFAVSGFVLSSAMPVGSYESIADHGSVGTLGGHIAAWYSQLTQGPLLLISIVFLILLFPDGRPLSPRWNIVIRLAILDTVATLFVSAFAPGPLSNYPSIDNPFGIGPLAGVFGLAMLIAFVAELALVAAAAVSFVLRFRRSRGDERLQLKWVLSAAVLLACIILAAPALWQLPNPVWTLTFLGGIVAVLAAVGVAMLKYRLYEIDLIINRALVYGSLSVTLAGLYIGGVIALQALFRAITGQDSQLAVAIVTLAVAALFNPWRTRVQHFIDRRFYRRKYDADRLLAQLNATFRDEVDLEHLTAEVLAVTADALQPASLAIWLAGRREISS